MTAYLVDYVRTPIGRYGGALSPVRPDDLAAVPLAALMERNPAVDWDLTDDVLLGCANQAGEDNRNVARMSLLLAGMSESVSGVTLNRLCGSGMDAAAMGARAVRAGDADLIVAGGVESMSRAPFVVAKPTRAFDRNAEMYDTTIGWRFVNPRLEEHYGVDSMPSTAENVAAEFGVERTDQDLFAWRTQRRTAAAQASGRLAREIVPVTVPRRRGDPVIVDTDEHPRPDTDPEKLAALRPIFPGGTVTAGNASGVNDGAAAMLIASEAAVTRYSLEPLARITRTTTVGVAPRIMGIAPAPATRKLLNAAGLGIDDIDLFELNEAFASQSLAVLRMLGLPDDCEIVNPNGGAIALGHPLGMSGARILGTAALEMRLRGAARAVATMCIGVGQGIATLLEAV